MNDGVRKVYILCGIPDPETESLDMGAGPSWRIVCRSGRAREESLREVEAM